MKDVFTAVVLGILCALLGVSAGIFIGVQMASAPAAVCPPPRVTCYEEHTSRTATECYTRLSEGAKHDAFVLCDRVHGKTSTSYDEVSCWSAEPYEDGSRKLFTYTLEQARADDLADAREAGAR